MINSLTIPCHRTWSSNVDACGSSFTQNTNEHKLFHSYRECWTSISWISLFWRSLKETTWSGYKVWSSTWLPRCYKLLLSQTMRWNPMKPQLWSSSEDICLTHFRRNTSLNRISGLFGSPLRSILTIRSWSTCLK